MKKLLIILVLFSCETNRSRNLDNLIIHEIKKTNVPPVVMGKIYKSGNMKFFSYGPSRWNRKDTIRKNNIFAIASLTKAITSVAALQLVENGQIKLDDQLDNILPEMSTIKILNNNNEIIEPTKSITLRHLLTHTAGFGYEFTSPKIKDWKNLKKKVGWIEKSKPRLFESGESFMYGPNIDWVGVLIERLSGMNLEDYFRKYITGPLEMNSTWFNVPDSLHYLMVNKFERTGIKTIKKIDFTRPKIKKKFSGGAGLFSSPDDYSKFLLCMLNKGNANGKRVLKESTFDKLNTKQLNNFNQIHRPVDVTYIESGPRGDKDNFFDNYDNWTLGWAYEQNSKYRPSGTAYWGGWNNYFTIDFKNEFALIYMNFLSPFNDIESYNLFTSFERIVYQNLD